MLEQLDDILSLFDHQHRELTPQEVTERTGRPESTVYRLLKQFREHGFLDYDVQTGKYRLGIKLATLGELAQHSSSIQRAAGPYLRQVSEKTGETATLMVMTGGKGMTVEVEEGEEPILRYRLLGHELPLHATAGGKAMLAGFNDEERVKNTLKLPLERYTQYTVTKLSDLFAELERVRERGASFVNGEWVEEIVGAGAAIRNYQGNVAGAVTVGGVRSRVSSEDLELMAEAAVEAADGVARSLGYQDGGDRLESVRRDG